MEKMFWRCILALAWLGVASAQNLSLGIAGGGAPTNAFETITNSGNYFHSESADYLIGATLEYHLPRRFSVEADGLFRELHLTDTFGTHISRTPVVTWEFPVLAKYRFGGSKLTPFVEMGPEYRTSGNLNDTNPSHLGLTAGAGVEGRWRGLQIAPAVRYTRWARDNNLSSVPQSKSDQLEVLLGISSRPRTFGEPLGAHFSIGAIAGMTLTHDQPSYSTSVLLITQYPPPPGAPIATVPGTEYDSGADTFLVGPTVEMALSQRLYIEGDAMYHRIRYSSRIVLDNGVNGVFHGTSASTWEFPVLAKLKFNSGRIRPFAEAGPSFRLPVQHISVLGFSVGGGVEIHWHGLKIAPAIRYTRWTKSSFGYFAIQEQLQPNQVELLTTFLL